MDACCALDSEFARDGDDGEQGPRPHKNTRLVHPPGAWVVMRIITGKRPN